MNVLFGWSGQIISGLNIQSKFQLFTIFSGRHVGVALQASLPPFVLNVFHLCWTLWKVYFDRIENITRETWNKHIEDLVPNAFLHIQADDSMTAETNSLVALANQTKEISQLAKGLPKTSNTVISRDMMTKRPRVWQAHLSKISDFLKHGPDVWWKWRKDGSVEFFDAPGEPNSREQGPQLNHYRSSNISKICQNLEETWERCACDPDQLPLYKMRDKDGKLIYLRESLSTEKLQEQLELEDPQPSHHVQVSNPECDENEN